MEENITCTPPEIRKIAENTVGNLLPEKSRDEYDKRYQKFEAWCEENKIEGISENVLIAYFEFQRTKYKAPTLWTTYSMLRSCLNVYKNVDISKYNKLQALLKRASQNYVPKKSQILAMKVILIMGYNGACRREELTNMSVDDIQYRADSVIVVIPKTKNNVPRTFAVTDQYWIDRNGYCINSPIGINMMGKVPKTIAAFLELPNPELYTGHCFRRSSATHIANAGGDLLTIKRLGGWKSSAIAESYVGSSLNVPPLQFCHQKLKLIQSQAKRCQVTKTLNRICPQHMA